MNALKYAVIAAAAMTLVSAGQSQAQIKIATAGPMTGQYASFGEQMQRGAELAVKDINAAGGVLGQKLVLSIGDDACDPKQAVAVANKFVSEGVSFVAGHFCSGSSIPASDVYEEEGVLHIAALIFVEREGQKKILIGKGGSRLRSIGTEARQDMEALFECKVMLRLWVKVKSGWSDDERALRSLGYDDA